MKFVIQRVSQAEVKVTEEVKVSEEVEASVGAGIVRSYVSGKIGRGFMVLIGVCDSDSEQIADRMIDKMCKLRIFEDAEGKTNLNLETVGGGLLLVSQFTLYADCRKGNRPSFIKAGSPEHAEELYNYIVEACRRRVQNVQTGSFGALMEVSLVNDGPFTIILDSEDLAAPRRQ